VEAGRSLPRGERPQAEKRRRLIDYSGVAAKFPWNRGRIQGPTNVLYELL